MPNVVGLVGFAGCGKDTAAKGLIADGWKAVAFADLMRAGLLLIDPVVTAAPQWRFTWWWPYDNWLPVPRCISRVVHLSELIDKYGWEDAKRLFPEIRRLLRAYGNECSNAACCDLWFICSGVWIFSLSFKGNGT